MRVRQTPHGQRRRRAMDSITADKRPLFQDFPTLLTHWFVRARHADKHQLQGTGLRTLLLQETYVCAVSTSTDYALPPLQLHIHRDHHIIASLQPFSHAFSPESRENTLRVCSTKQVGGQHDPFDPAAGLCSCVIPFFSSPFHHHVPLIDTDSEELATI